MLLEGIFLPLTTPFHADGRLFLKKLEHNVERYSRTPAAGLFVLGPGGEGEGLTDHEACEVLGTAIAGAGAAKVMVAGVGRESVAATLALAEAAAAVGYDAVAVQAPELARDSTMRLETVTYFQAVADRAALPVVLVSAAARELETDVVLELAGHPQVIGVMDERAAERVEELKARTAGVRRDVTVTPVFAAVTGRMLRQHAGSLVSAASLAGGGAAAVVPAAGPGLRTRVKSVGFQVLSGSTTGMLAAWQAGAVGAVPRLGAASPQACCEVYQAWKDGEPAVAEEKQLRVRAAALRMEGFGGAAWSKYGCDLNGYFGGRPRLPLLGLNGAQREELEREMSGLKS
jgi:dihydrodipicolinate synthase/N-acetylneuraminate lyase